MVTFKEKRGKLYYTQHTLLSNVGQLPILFFEKQTHTYTRKRKMGSQNFFFNIKYINRLILYIHFKRFFSNNIFDNFNFIYTLYLHIHLL